MADLRSRSVRGFVALVIVAGVALTAWALGSDAFRTAARSRGYWLLALMLLLGEVFPISVPRRGGQVHEITASTAFAFAVLIAYGTSAAIVAQVVASVVTGVVVRRSPQRIAFDAGRYAVALAAAGIIYAGLGGAQDPDVGSILPFVLSALVFFFLSVTITDVAWVPEGVPLDRYLLKDLFLQAQATLPLLALAPVVVAASQDALWLVPLAAAPAVAVWWGTRLAMENGRLVQQLQGSLDQEKELNLMKNEFVAVVSHELRTPLTSIQGYLKTLLQLGEDLPDDQRTSFLEAADRQGDRLRRLIEQLLVVGRLDGHVEPLALAWVDLDRLTSEVVDELRAGANGHTFDVRLPATLPAVHTDEGKLHQILSNLVENALKYAPPDTRVTILAEPGVNGVVVRVIDEGPGIPPDAHERIFERFFQVDQSATRRVGGTGLGLYICRRMAEAIGGRLTLARSDATGSEFSLFVPTVDAPRAVADEGREPAARQA
jgi:signal transduction histidine kinase